MFWLPPGFQSRASLDSSRSGTVGAAEVSLFKIAQSLAGSGTTIGDAVVSLFKISQSLAGSEGAGGGTTVFTGTPDTAEPGWDGYTIRQQFVIGGLSAATGSHVAISVLFSALGSGETVTLYFGRYDAGTPLNFTGNQVHVTFGGGDIVGNGTTVAYTSDIVALGEAFDNTVGYMLAFQLSGGQTATLLYGATTTPAGGHLAPNYHNGLEAAATVAGSYSGIHTDDAYIVTNITITT